MTKICLVKWVIDGVDGGLKMAIQLSNELSSDAELHLVSMNSTVGNLFFDLDPKVTYKNFHRGRQSLAKTFLKNVGLLRNYLKNHEIDYVVSVGISANALIVASAIGLKTKTVVWEHMNSIESEATKSNKIQRWLGAKLANKLIVLTDKDLENYTRSYRVRENKIIRIYNWMEPVAIREKSPLVNKKIVTVGRIVSQKGYDILFEVAKRILLQNTSWKWYIYGSGDEKIMRDLEEQIEQAGLQERLLLAGVAKKLDNIYLDKSIYVMTSRFEGFGLVLLEAKQFGLPIVSFDCPCGPSEIIRNDINGYLIEDFSIDKMAVKIQLLMDNLDTRKRFGQNSMNSTDKFEKDRVLKQWRELFKLT